MQTTLLSAQRTLRQSESVTRRHSRAFPGSLGTVKYVKDRQDCHPQTHPGVIYRGPTLYKKRICNNPTTGQRACRRPTAAAGQFVSLYVRCTSCSVAIVCQTTNVDATCASIEHTRSLRSSCCARPSPLRSVIESHSICVRNISIYIYIYIVFNNIYIQHVDMYGTTKNVRACFECLLVGCLDVVKR